MLHPLLTERYLTLGHNSARPMLLRLPVELLERVYDYLAIQDQRRVNLTCKRLRDVMMRRWWTNLEFTLHEKDHPESIALKGWVGSRKSCLDLFDREFNGIWIVIGKDEIEEFLQLWKRRKLDRQLGWVRSVNFDQQVLTPASLSPAKKRRFSLGSSKHNGSGSQHHIESLFMEAKRRVSVHTMKRLYYVRVRVNDSGPVGDVAVTVDMLRRLERMTYLATTGDFSALRDGSIDHVMVLDLYIRDLKQLPPSLPSVHGLELHSPYPLSGDAHQMKAWLGQLPNLSVLTLINISLNNPQSIKWLPRSVTVLGVSVAHGNFLEGRLGNTVEYPNIRVYIVRDPHGFVSRIMPTGLNSVMFDYSTNDDDGTQIGEYGLHLIQKNPHLQNIFVNYPTPQLARRIKSLGHNVVLSGLGGAGGTIIRTH